MARSKYGVNKDKSDRTYNNISFDSKIEMQYYRDIVLPKFESGEIIEYELQKEYILQPDFIHEGKKILPIKYVADFQIKYKDGHEEVIDTKGFPDHVAPLKRKMFQYLFPEVNFIQMAYCKKYGGWLKYEELQKLRKQNKKDKKEKENGCG